MVEIKVGKKCFEFGLGQWPEGRALLPAEDGAVAAPATPRKIIGAAPDGRILRLFPPKRTAHELASRWRA